MARHARQPSESGIHHVMLRGINKQAIFLDDEDRERFLTYLGVVKQLSGCLLLAYCLMTNHVHLVVRAGDEPIGSVVKRLGVRYVRWFNRKYNRVGHLFQDRFASRPVDDDAYLQTLLRYVWNNPVQAGLAPSPDAYRWSSLRLRGGAGGLVDDSDLLRYMTADTLAELATTGLQDAGAPSWPIPDRDRLTEAAAAAEVRLVAEAFRVNEVRELPLVRRRRAVAELLERGLSSRQLARLTGLSQTAVLRLAREEAGAEAEAFEW